MQSRRRAGKGQNDMKGNKTFEIEIQRANVTPAQFLAYVRSRVDAKGGRMLRSDLDTRYFAAGDDLNFDIHHEGGELDGLHEKSISRPYEMQTFLRYANGATYNEICEFDFDDDKTGHGYYYLVNVDAVEDENATESAEESTEEATETDAEDDTTESTETSESGESETTSGTDYTRETAGPERAGADERDGHERRRTPERDIGGALSARSALSASPPFLR